ncbi:MAG: glutamine-hydrolyzing GMP synthase [Candidatus Moranbacteria bacterium]|nr:glutamine-hydrolyzing GMP synthase [Candidatus Moranbacteria bacterium]
MKKNPKAAIIILDFGSQTTQLIARRIRDTNVYCEILPFNTPAQKIKNLSARGIILSGGPGSLYELNSPHPDPAIFTLGLPILGICYGLQIITDHYRGEVIKGDKKKEYGKTRLFFSQKAINNEFLKKINLKTQTVWMSHGDEIKSPPETFITLAGTNKSPYAIIAHPDKKIYGVQFHPEVTQTVSGRQLLENFVVDICQCEKNWKPKKIIQQMIDEVKTKAGKKKVLHAISGGTDSTIMAEILHQALGDNLKCIMVDTGLLRKNEAQTIKQRFNKYLKVKVEIVNAKKRFLKKLEGVTDGQERRKIIGREYIEVFKKYLKKDYLLSQGTLYPDVIESAACDVTAPAHTIKTHHNRTDEVLELMKQGRVLEIFKNLFKDEVRKIGRTLKLPKEIVHRQPFPGPGLAIRILGEITEEKLTTLKEADAIVIEELKKADLYYKISQSVIALDSHMVTCVKGDATAKGYLIFIRNIKTKDFMTITPYELPKKIRQTITTRILNEVPLAGRVLFDESNKPPATVCYL